MQTYSFFGKQNATGERVLAALTKKYLDVKTTGDATPTVGITNAQDAMQLVALAIQEPGSTNHDAIRQAMYRVDRYDGLVKTYVKPFNPDDGLDENDCTWTRFIGNEMLPMETASK